MSEGAIGILILAFLIALVLLRVPVSLSLLIAALPPLLLDPHLSPTILLDRMRVQFGAVLLTAIPFFMLAANLMNRAGITDRLINLSMGLVGFLKGGLGYVNIMVSMFFAGVSGSSNADAAGIGSILIPAMKKQNYDINYTVAVTACSAVMGCIIPPSIMMIVWASTMNVSVGGMLVAGIIPGVLIGSSQMVVNYVYSARRNYPKYTERFSFKGLAVAAKDAVWALLTPLIIVFGIVGGIVTPTEASAIAVVYALILGLFVYRTLDFKGILQELLNTAKLTAIILFAIGTAAIYGWVFSYYRVPASLVAALGRVTTSPTLMLTLAMLCFMIVGCFLDAVPAIILLGPLLQPVVVATGVAPLHFGIVCAVTLGVGLITPPYGLTLLISSKIAGINCMQPLKEVAVFFVVMCAILASMILLPDVYLVLPRLFGFAR